MNSTSPKTFWQTFLWASILLSLLAIYGVVQRASELEIVLWRSKWVLVVVLFMLNAVGGIFALRWLSGAGSNGWIEKLEFNSGSTRSVDFPGTARQGRCSPHAGGKERRTEVRVPGLIGLLGLALLIAGFALVWVVRLFVFGDILPGVFPILWVFLWMSLIQTLGLKLLTGRAWPALFAVVVLVQGLLYQVYGHLAIITDNPFSMGYSEAGRHYYASLFFADAIYGQDLPLPFLHPSRYLLMSIPFLIEGLPLWVHRMWQALLWIGLTGTSSILLARRLQLKGWMKFFVAAWAFLFFLQGAVYYHLQICVTLILIGVSPQRPGRSLLFIILASLWAGISRVNWFPVPAMLGIAIYVLEMLLGQKGWRYWVTPFIWGLCGVAAALASQFVYIRISGNADVRNFGSSFTSDLLWNRLLPNETFPPGILPGIIIVALPLLLAISQMVKGRVNSLPPLRWLALLGLLLVLFLGGMVVSTKIGGGGDLHNMDAFLVLLALIATTIFAGQVVSEDGTEPAWGQVHWSVTAAALLVPLGFALPQIGFLPGYDSATTQRDVQRIQEVTAEAVAEGGEVLFVTERQLITFGIVKNIPLVPEYEQIELMELAMSGNRAQLEQYYADLHSHRFALIIAEDQKFTTQKEGAFVEENVAWVRYAGAPLLCAYKPIETLQSSNIVVFIPRPSNPDCRDPFGE
ncbi:MAG: hypothetical protein AB1649_01095 [Chloroflexota bacterium]